jgi:hypothetical protein
MKIKPIVDSILKEASLSRIWQHIQNGKTFAVISAYRGSNSEQENRSLHEKLKQDVRSKGYGFIEQKSGYTYANPQTGEEGNVEEQSLFIPEISKADAVSLATKYQQESILWKDTNEFVLYYVSSGKTDPFNRGTSKDLTFNADVLKYAYSQFLKSKNKNAIKKFAYVMKELRVPSREEAYRALKERSDVPSATWIDVIGE